MSEDELGEEEYTPPAITRRETIESLGATGAGAGMLAGSPPAGIVGDGDEPDEADEPDESDEADEPDDPDEADEPDDPDDDDSDD